MLQEKSGRSSAGRALASQAKGRGSESRRPLQCYQRLREFLSEPIFYFGTALVHETGIYIFGWGLTPTSTARIILIFAREEANTITEML